MRIDERSVRMMRLLEYLNDQERPAPFAELADLAGREFGVSEVTLRSDLSALCALRSIRKSARAMYEAAPGNSAWLPGATLFGTRLQHRAEAKIAIAGAAAEALAAQPDLRVLLLDGGTTAYYVADRLAERSGLDVVIWTPNVAAASRLAGTRGVSVRLLGGEFHPDYAVVSGDETARALRALAGVEGPLSGHEAPLESFPGAHCLLDVNHVSADGRLFTDESTERLQKRLMAQLADEVTLVADASKLFAPRLGMLAHEVEALADFRQKRSFRLITDLSATAEQRAQAQSLFEMAFAGHEITFTPTETALRWCALRPD